MSIKLKCPTCRERFFAEDSDRGGSLKCPGCGTAVPVPTGDGSSSPPASASGFVKALPKRPPDDDVVDADIVTAPIVTAQPIVTASRIVSAEVVKRKSDSVPVVAPLPQTSDDEDDAPKRKSRTGFRLRGEDEDERDTRRSHRDDREDAEDDHPDGEEPETGGGSLLYIIIGVGVLLLAGIGFSVYYLTKEDSAPVVQNPPDNNAGIIPGPGPAPIGPAPKPNIPNQPKKQFEGWDTITGDGFTMFAPKDGLAEGPFGAGGLNGKIWIATETGTGIKCSGASLNRGDNRKVPKPLELAREAFQLTGGRVVGTRPINGRECIEMQFDNDGGTSSRVWFHLTEERLFLFRYQCSTPVSPEAAEKRDKFQANIKVSYPLGVVDPVDVADPGPRPGPFPGPRPQTPAPEAPFQPVLTAGEDGFNVEMPGGAKIKGERHTYGVEGKYHLGGKKFEAKDGEYTFHLYYHDLPNESDYDTDKCLTPLLPFPWKAANSVDAKIAGQPAQQWTLTHHTFQNSTPGATVRVGFRVFTLLVSKTGLPNGNGMDAIAEERGKKFIDSLKISFDPKKAPTVASDPKWVPMARTIGFVASAPPGTNAEDYTAGFGFEMPKGKHYSSEDDTVKCHVYIVQMTPKHDPEKTVKDMLDRQKITSGPKPVTAGGMTWDEYETEGFPFNEKNRVRIGIDKVNGVAVMLRVQPKARETPEREVVLKTRAFMNGFQYGGAGGIAGPVEVGNGEFVSPGKVSPHWTSVVLLGKKELLTFGTRNADDPKPGGFLRRYSYPEFKLKATYHLPLPVNRVAADEKTGKLLCSVITRFNPNLDQREAVSWTSDLQIFDLKKITDSTAVEGEELKPLGSRITIGNAISGLEIEPNGGYAYASVVILPTNPKAVATGRLYRINMEKGEKDEVTINHPEPLNGLRIAPLGRTLVTSEYGQARPGKQFNLLTVDGVTWKKSKLIPIPAPALDLTFTNEGVLALAPNPDGKTRIFGYSEGSPETLDVTPKELPVDGFSYLRVTENGKKAILVAGAKQNGVLLLNVQGEGDKAKFTKVTSGNSVGGVAVGGHFVLTPDSKFAVFNSGAIIDLEKTAPAKDKD